ncbi:MAG: YtxH domain-containing protein [Nitrospinae bacterium]|nr:YtxH domain-containing protein [Nitrospinota bacterium]MBF0633565.1 YtxH domain-containing protein [Nitrospinota bacterium]
MCGNGHSGGTNTIFGVLLGGAIGVALALLYAPASGEETRKRIRDGAERAKMRTKEEYEAALEEIEERLEAMKSSVNETKDEVRVAYEAGKEAYRKEKAKHQEA